MKNVETREQRAPGASMFAASWYGLCHISAIRHCGLQPGFPKVEIMTIVTIDESVTLTQTPDAERLMAEQLYGKGKNFIGAARLLRQCGGDEYVVLHLLCQGLEITLKALLLLRNFANYRPRLRNYGHDLMRLASDALKEFKLHPLRPAVSTALGVFTTR